MQKLKVGCKTYGSLEIYEWGAKNEFLEIGNYVSIAEETKFILGGNHNIDTFSTYPYKVMINGDKNESWSKGKIDIRDDVWIGMNCIILSGVKIGKGAIVGAGSVVSKDVPPCAIVVGNPAKIIRFRIPENLIETFKNIDMSKSNNKFII